MMMKQSAFLSAISVALLAGAAQAQCTDWSASPFTVTVTGVDCLRDAEVFTSCEDITGFGDWRLRLSVFGDRTGTFTVESDGSGPKIAELILQADDTDGVCRVIVQGPSGDLFDITDIEEIFHAEPEHVGTSEVVSLKCSGDVGSIEANILGRLDIQGDVTGDIVLVSRPSGNSDLQNVAITGDLLGDVTVSFGRIEGLSTGDNIGTSSTPVTISARDAIWNIDGDNIYANITAKNGATWKPVHRIDAALVFDGSLECETIKSIGGASGVPELEVLTLDATVTLHGDLAEDIMVIGNVNAKIEIEGDLSGDIDITGSLADDILIRIEGALANAATITLGTSGLIGQIIMNAANGTDTWIGDITVGTTTLSPEPHYTQGMASLGGGAVGEAQFGFHKTDSEPDWDSTVTIALPTQVKISHYGPVHRTTGLSGVGVVTVDRRPIVGGIWVSVSTDFVVDGSTSQTGFRTDILVKPTAGNAYEDGFEYRIQPVAGKLACCHVDTCPDVD